MKRRQFISKSVKVTAGTIILPTIIPSRVIGQNPPSDMINIGQIGFGRIAMTHDLAETLKYDSARVVAVADFDSIRLKKGKQFIESFYAKKTGNPAYLDVKTFDNYKELLADKGVDAVIISLACTACNRSGPCRKGYLSSKAYFAYNCGGQTPERYCKK